MKKYTALLTMEDTCAAMDAGEYVEVECDGCWAKDSLKIIDSRFKYRLVEEIEETPLQQGDEILVWDDGWHEKAKVRFIYFWKDRVITEYGGDVASWDHWKPLEPERKAMEGWVNKAINLHNKHTNNDQIFMREVLPETGNE